MTFLKNKKVLVTGGSGFIASHLCHRLVKDEARVFVLTKYDSIIDNIRLADLWNKVTFIEADLRNPDSLKEIHRFKPEYIYHFAAYNHVGDSFTHISEAIDVNSKGTVNLLEAYQDYKRFIYISSSETYGYQEKVPFAEGNELFPISPYAVGKYSGELYARMKCKVFKKPIVILKPFNAFGPGQSPRAIIAELIIKCLRGEDVVTTEGVQTRDFNYIRNLVDGFILAGEKEGIIGEVINLGSGKEISIRDLVKMIHSLSGSTSRLRIGELPYRPTEIWRMVADNSKARKLLGWDPAINLEAGLVKTIEWYRKFNNLFMKPGSDLQQLCQYEI